jgi:hypothetical protein
MFVRIVLSSSVNINVKKSDEDECLLMSGATTRIGWGSGPVK